MRFVPTKTAEQQSGLVLYGPPDQPHMARLWRLAAGDGWRRIAKLAVSDAVWDTVQPALQAADATPLWRRVFEARRRRDADEQYGGTHHSCQILAGLDRPPLDPLRF
jgi:hypothetical protein